MIWNLLERLMPLPAPCPQCGFPFPETWFVGGGYEALLPFWVRLRCPRCKHWGKRKLFRSRAIRAWNKEAQHGRRR